jgi:murein DD-endopeptidase MepM/ murein hydrolase activator NlpD
MSRGKVVAAVAGGCALAVLTLGAGVGAAVLMLFGGGSTGLGGGNECGAGQAPLPPGSGSPVAGVPALDTAVGNWRGEQLRNAATIVAVGRQLDIPPRGWVVAVGTAMQESGLRNLPGGERDSIGVLQQRPSQGWGAPEQLAQPAYQARKFYEKLLTVDGWEAMRLTDAAQLVQRSAFPEAYQRWEGEAEAVVAAVAGVASVALLGGGFPGAPCGLAGVSAVIPVGTWTRPVKASIVSGFRTPDRPGHDGVDFAAPRYTPVVAASAGTVLTVVCNSSTGTCDRDGGMSVRGCGWYVEVLHPGDVVSRYCHLVRQPEVSVGQAVQGGQVLGFVGSSGNSSGPHLHFEIHQGHPATAANAVDPMPFMARAGAPLAPV